MLSGQGSGASYFLIGGLRENDYFVSQLGERLGALVTICPQARFAGVPGAAERALALPPSVRLPLLGR